MGGLDIIIVLSNASGLGTKTLWYFNNLTLCMSYYYGCISEIKQTQ